jgi:hypothetical protein
VKIHRSRPEARFTIIPDETLRDPRLSYNARGILGELLSRPDDWQTTADAITKAAARHRGREAEGRRKIAQAFAELERARYLRRVRTRGPGGKFATEVHVYDRPYDAGEATGIPTGGQSARPAGIDVCTGRTDIPLTDMSVDRQSVNRLTGKRSVITETEDENSFNGDGFDGDGTSKTEGQDHSAANSHNPRVHHGPQDPSSDDQQSPIPVTRRSPAADRNARTRGAP